MRLSDKEKLILQAALGVSPGHEMEAYLMLVQYLRPRLRPKIGWRKFGKLTAVELVEEFLKEEKEWKAAGSPGGRWPPPATT